MRDKTHGEQVERWARYCKEHPQEFKKKIKPFLDAQIIIARNFYKRLEKSEEGRKILLRLKNNQLL